MNRHFTLGTLCRVRVVRGGKGLALGPFWNRRDSSSFKQLNADLGLSRVAIPP
jgi:hypothetical protein